MKIALLRHESLRFLVVRRGTLGARYLILLLIKGFVAWRNESQWMRKEPEGEILREC